MTQQATKKQAMTVNDVEQQVRELAQQAKLAARVLAGASAATRNAALLATCEVLHERRDSLLEANALDMARGRETGLDAALLDRLELTPARLQGLLGSLQQVAALPDPVGAIDHVRTMPSGIRVGKMRVPLGVIAIIYESRPNVTVEAASLCLKAGNAAILRGGSEAIESNLALGCLPDRRHERGRLTRGGGTGGAHHRSCCGRRVDHCVREC